MKQNVYRFFKLVIIFITPIIFVSCSESETPSACDTTFYFRETFPNMNSSSADLTESTFPETESFYWDVLVTLGGRVVESFKLSSEFRSFSLSLDERKLYSVLVAATSETGERVTLGSVFPYQRELTRAGGLSSTVLKEVYRLYSLRGIRGNESVEQAKLFNWAKFTSSLEERSSAFRNGENITVRNIDKVAKSIVEKKFTLSMIKVISVESDRGSR